MHRVVSRSRSHSGPYVFHSSLHQIFFHAAGLASASWLASCAQHVTVLAHEYMGGWPLPHECATTLLSRLSAERADFLRTKALLVLRLPAPKVPDQAGFRWLLAPPPDLCYAESVWTFDGSMLFGTWKPLRTVGFGIVVTTVDGELLAHGCGVPPQWCATAAAAEAWALRTRPTAPGRVDRTKAKCWPGW